MTPVAAWPRRVLPAVLLAATGLFVLGVSREPDDGAHHDESTAVAGGHDDESAERAEGDHAESDHAEGAEAGEESEAGEEQVLGLDLESPLLVTVAVVVSVALAALAGSRRDRPLLVVIAVVAAGFAVLDVAELVHQLDEDRPGFAVLAATVAALHALAATLAARQSTADVRRASAGTW